MVRTLFGNRCLGAASNYHRGTYTDQEAPFPLMLAEPQAVWPLVGGCCARKERPDRVATSGGMLHAAHVLPYHSTSSRAAVSARANRTAAGPLRRCLHLPRPMRPQREPDLARKYPADAEISWVCLVSTKN